MLARPLSLMDAMPRKPEDLAECVTADICSGYGLPHDLDGVNFCAGTYHAYNSHTTRIRLTYYRRGHCQEEVIECIQFVRGLRGKGLAVPR